MTSQEVIHRPYILGVSLFLKEISDNVHLMGLHDSEEISSDNMMHHLGVS
jgi:hypothetical protein